MKVGQVLYSKTLSGIQWHPKAPAIASTTKSGDILLWHCPTAERWGAFAGGFEEVDENVEYEEREDEFDIASSFSRFFAFSHIQLTYHT